MTNMFKTWQVILMFFYGFVTITIQSTCPEPCVCSPDLKTIHCNNKKLTKIPEDIPSEVEQLYLSDNIFTNLPDKVFNNLQNLGLLELRQCKIMKISPLAFKGLTNLKKLYLQSNNVVKIENGTFQDLSKLQDLILGQNRLSQIPSAITDLKSLKLIDLSANKIAMVLFPSGMKTLIYLQDLYLNMNPLGKIKCTDIDNIRDLPLISIHLNNCELVEIEAGSLKGLHYLQSLVLSFNPFNATMLGNALKDMTSSVSLQSLDVSSLNINAVLPNTTFIDLGPSIFHLFVSHNFITEIEAGTFQSFTNLQTLDLAYNSLTNPNMSSYLTMEHLKSLKLSHNSLISVPIGLPSNLQDSLDLAFNSISKVSNNSFLNLSNLKFLKFMNNEIEAIESFCFNGLNSLTSLDLSFNKISVFGNGVFKPLKSLQNINLHSNKFSIISEEMDLFGSLDKLEYLDFSSNNLSSISSGLFKGLKTLKNLTLQQNLISYIPVGLFDNQANLELLDMSQNLIASINSTTLNGLVNLKWLNLSQNPFSCSCELLWFRSWVNETNVILLNLDNYLCHSPEEWRDKKLILFLRTHIDCSVHTISNSLLIIVLPVCCGVFIIFCISISLFCFRWNIKFYIYNCKKNKGYYSEILSEVEFDLFINSCEKDNDILWSFIQELLKHKTFNEEKSLQISSKFNYIPNKNKIENLVYFSNKSVQVIVILTQNYFNSALCLAELKYMLEIKQSKNVIFIEKEILSNYQRRHFEQNCKMIQATLLDELFLNRLYALLNMN